MAETELLIWQSRLLTEISDADKARIPKVDLEDEDNEDEDGEDDEWAIWNELDPSDRDIDAHSIVFETVSYKEAVSIVLSVS
jgi:hypothetical protein